MGKRYDEAFRLRAARQIVLEGMTYEAVSSGLGASVCSIRDWVKKFRASGALPPAGEPQPVADELRRLRAENRSLREDVEILKKATAYFVKNRS
jgi:transposase